MDKREKIEQIHTRISELKNVLSAQSSEFGDWKLMKQLEASIQGFDLPYTDEDMQNYHAARAKVRNEINELEAQLTKETM